MQPRRANPPRDTITIHVMGRQAVETAAHHLHQCGVNISVGLKSIAALEEKGFED